MGHHCCVPHCYANSARHVALKFYVVPKDQAVRKPWVRRIRNETLRSHARVCSLHFVDGKKSYGEIPSIFPWSSNWEVIVNKYNADTQAEYDHARLNDSNVKKPAILTLSRPASASRSCVPRPRRPVRTSTPEKVRLCVIQNLKIWLGCVRVHMIRWHDETCTACAVCQASISCFSGKLWYLQHDCVGDTIVY